MEEREIVERGYKQLRIQRITNGRESSTLAHCSHVAGIKLLLRKSPPEALLAFCLVCLLVMMLGKENPGRVSKRAHSFLCLMEMLASCSTKPMNGSAVQERERERCKSCIIHTWFRHYSLVACSVFTGG